MKIELITIGSELLAGQTLTTNALYLLDMFGVEIGHPCRPHDGPAFRVATFNPRPVQDQLLNGQGDE